MIPFLDLTRQYQKEKKQISKAFSAVLSSGHYLNGEKLRRFEGEFTAFLGVKEAIATGSGTDAIALSLLALGLKSGDKGDFPVAEEACQTVLSLPMYPFLTKKEVQIICKEIRSFFQEQHSKT